MRFHSFKVTLLLSKIIILRIILSHDIKFLYDLLGSTLQLKKQICSVLTIL